MSKVLSATQVEAYRRDGLLFPVAALDESEVAHFRAIHDEFDRVLGGRPIAQQKGECHLHYQWACRLATHPRVLDAVEDLIGPNILIHSSTVFAKYPGDSKFVSWHQDSHYWGLSEPRLASAWIALTESTVENGCLRVLPGTHHRRFAHNEERHEHNILGKGLTVAESLNDLSPIDVVLRPGEMSLHHADLVHGSNANGSDGPRIGFAVRYVATSVRQTKPHHPVILARGDDDYHYYDIVEKPTADLEAGLVAQTRFESLRS